MRGRGPPGGGDILRKIVLIPCPFVRRMIPESFVGIRLKLPEI